MCMVCGLGRTWCIIPLVWLDFFRPLPSSSHQVEYVLTVHIDRCIYTKVEIRRAEPELKTRQTQQDSQQRVANDCSKGFLKHICKGRGKNLSKFSLSNREETVFLFDPYSSPFLPLEDATGALISPQCQDYTFIVKMCAWDGGNQDEFT